MRAAVLALLAEEPRHGYSIMVEIGARSGGTWRPSPGSIYPVLQQLQDEGLIAVTEAEGRRVFAVTEQGAAFVAAHPEEMTDPWSVEDDASARRERTLHEDVTALAAAVGEVARVADDAQIDQARRILDDARRSMYRLLAGDLPAE